jgi:hypothetical protein
MKVVCFLLGNSPASEFYMLTFRNTLFRLHRQVGMKKFEIKNYYKHMGSYRVNILALYFTLLWNFVLVARWWSSFYQIVWLCLNKGKKISGCVLRIEDFSFYVGYGGVWISSSIIDLRKKFLHVADRWQTITVGFCERAYYGPRLTSWGANLRTVRTRPNSLLVRNLQL